MSQTQSNSDQTLTGCVVRREKAVYLQPTSGEPIRLSGDQDWSDLSHQSKITGHYGSADQSANSANANANAQPGQGSVAGNAGSSSAQTGQDFIVTRVETTTESCPASSSGSANPPSSSTPPPRR